MYRSVNSYSLRCRWWVLLGLLGLVIGLTASTWLHRAAATAPVDARSTAPNHPAEIAGAGYLLSEPGHGTHWVGAYRTIAGLKAYCVDRYYDYPDPAYGYRTSEVSGWTGRAGSNNGANGHTAQRIIWIVNSYGQSTSAATNAATSAAINLLIGSAAFQQSYDNYFRPQLMAINPAIVAQINQLLADSDQFAGPYTTRVTFGAAPAVGGVGEFAVSVRSAKGFPVRNAGFGVTSLRGGRLRAPVSATTGPSGVVRLQYTALGAGVVAATAVGTAPNVTMRLGIAPTHNTENFRTGSQRVAVVSSTPLKAVPSGSGKVTVLPPIVTTQVVAGNGPRPVGALVTDNVAISGIVPNRPYSLNATLLDVSGRSCGTVTMALAADRVGQLSAVTPPLAVCGGGTNTFIEQLRDQSGRLLAETPPGQPSETFPVTPAVTTAVVGGTNGRIAGSAVTDEVAGNGFLPNMTYRVEATLQDGSGQVCGTVTTAVTADSRGELHATTAPIAVCGSGTNTFAERLMDAGGSVVATTPPGQPSETFPVVIPAPVVVTPPVVPERSVQSPGKPPVTKSLPTTTTPAKPRARPAPVVRRVVQAVPITARPAPLSVLAATGSTALTPLLVATVLLGVGGLLVTGSRRRVR